MQSAWKNTNSNQQYCLHIKREKLTINFLLKKPSAIKTFSHNTYIKRITFGGVFVLIASFAVESLHQIKYITKCSFIKVSISGFQINHQIKPTLNSRKSKECLQYFPI